MRTTLEIMQDTAGFTACGGQGSWLLDGSPAAGQAAFRTIRSCLCIAHKVLFLPPHLAKQRAQLQTGDGSLRNRFLLPQVRRHLQAAIPRLSMPESDTE